MALLTYDDLILTVKDYTHRNDLGTKIDDFILLAETEMKSNPDEPLKMNLSEDIVTAPMVITTRFLALPTGFESSRKFSITVDGSIGGLEYRTPEQLIIRDDTGVPCFFTIRGNEIEFDIVPDDTYTITVTYFAEFTALTEDNQTNIVLTKYPNIYLFGCLRQAFIYAQDTEQEQKYTVNFLSAIESANMKEHDVRYGPQPQQTVAWAP
jgi:hypothetical protein